MEQTQKISIVISVYNEAEVLPEFALKLEDSLNQLNNQFEVIFVNDGSTDGSLNILTNIKKQSAYEIIIANLSRNYGHEAAMICGIDHTTGDAVICLDSDLQHPVTLIGNMIAAHLDGHDIVTMVREKREDNSLFKNWLSRRFYGLINRLSEYRLDENASDFFLISRRVATVLQNDFRERNRFLRGFIQIVGFDKTNIHFIAPKRAAGNSKYSFFKLIKLSANAVISFSKLPLYLGIYIGILFAIFSFILGIYTFWQFIVGNNPPSGYTTIVLFLSLSFSVLFILIGIIGAYIGYIFDENKGRPIYIVKNII